MGIAIVKAVCNQDLTVDLFFNDNSHRKINIGNFIKENPHPHTTNTYNGSISKLLLLSTAMLLGGKIGI